MRLSELVRVDSKGRIMLPRTIREAFNLGEGMYLMLIADVTSREVRLIPFADPSAKLAEVRVALADVPGALARVATVLAKQEVDLLSTSSRTLHRGESAEWHSVVDLSKCRCKISELKEKILEDGAAKGVEISELR